MYEFKYGRHVVCLWFTSPNDSSLQRSKRTREYTHLATCVRNVNKSVQLHAEMLLNDSCDFVKY